MLKLYDRNHNYLCALTQLKDYKIDSETASGEKTLSCVVLHPPDELQAECYIRTATDEYVVKEINISSDGFPVITAALNLEELEGKAWKVFSVTDVNITIATRLAIAGTGWTVNDSAVYKRRDAGIMKKSALGVINDLCKVFMCEVTYDTINKTISFVEQKGQDRGVYFLSGLNLRNLSKRTGSYDYYTRLIPYGKDDLDIKDVNSGVEYVENYQYSNKVRTYIWVDTNYTDASALKTDAIAKLADMSKPEVSYTADVRDLAAMSDIYSLLDYGVGDSITLIDKNTGTKDKQRIVKMTEYPDEPERNTCELSNVTLTWEEMNRRMSEAAAIIDAVISPDGQYNGTISVSDILHFENGVVDSSTGTTLATALQTTNGRLGVLELAVGTIEANYLTADEIAARYTNTETLVATYATIQNLNAVSADVQGINARVASIEDAYITTAQVDTLLAGYAQITLANIDTANINKGKMKDLFVEVGMLASDATIISGKITGYLDAVQVNAANITAGTLVADRIAIRGSNTALVYALNNYGQLTSQEVNTLDGYVLTPRTINADKIIAGTITGNEIAASTITAGHINVLSLSAINADLGAITAGTLQSADYTAASSGNYSATGMLIDLNNKTIKAPKFAVTSSGVLYATDAVISGSITATTGQIGPLTITTSSLDSGSLTISADNSYVGTYVQLKNPNDSNMLTKLSSNSIGFLYKLSGQNYCNPVSIAITTANQNTASGYANFESFNTQNGDSINRVSVQSMDYPKIILKGKTTDAGNTWNNPFIRFENSDSSQSLGFAFTDYDTYQTPAAITLVGMSGGGFFITPNLRVTSTIYMHNNGFIYTKTGGGTVVHLTGMNTSNQMFFGYGSYNAGVGESYFDGNKVYIRSNTSVTIDAPSGLTLPATTNATLSTATATNTSYITAGNITFYKKGFMVTVYGSPTVSALSSRTQIATIPAGYRPVNAYIGHIAGTTTQIIFNTDGKLTMDATSAGQKWFTETYVVG